MDNVKFKFPKKSDCFLYIILKVWMMRQIFLADQNQRLSKRTGVKLQCIQKLCSKFQILNVYLLYLSLDEAH